MLTLKTLGRKTSLRSCTEVDSGRTFDLDYQRDRIRIARRRLISIRGFRSHVEDRGQGPVGDLVGVLEKGFPTELGL